MKRIIKLISFSFIFLVLSTLVHSQDNSMDYLPYMDPWQSFSINKVPVMPLERAVVNNLEGKPDTLEVTTTGVSEVTVTATDSTILQQQKRLLDIDSLKRMGITIWEPRDKPTIQLTQEQAIGYLDKIVLPENWKEENDPLKMEIERLLTEAAQEKFDSTEYFLSTYRYDSLKIPWERFYNWDTLYFSVPTTSIPDTILAPEREATLTDTTIYIMTGSLGRLIPYNPAFPFKYASSPYQSDSLYTAVNTLLTYIQTRDSTEIAITGRGSGNISVWLNSRERAATRYWLKSDVGDSVTVWISSPSRNTLDLELEHGVNFRRPILQSSYSEARIEREEIDNTVLLDAGNIYIKRQYWKTRTDASFALNQTGMGNWVSGGENTIAFTTEIIGYADYNNKPKKLSSANFARLKYGVVASEEYGIRKNVDLLETSSKLNTKAFGKFDFSGYMLIKTTIAKGYKYPNDSTVVSKFMNPGTFTLGLGLDYKPNRNLSVNFSPVSYKATIVSDTAGIDESLYGIEKGRKTKHEPGMSLLFSNTWEVNKQIKLVNNLQLFTNYIDNPQNVDIDWEMTLTAKLNWFTEFKLNTHLKFDDDTKTLEYDKEKNPVLWPDGTQKKNARLQFKEIIGVSLVFKF